MSHVTDVRLRIKPEYISALATAADKCGLELREKTTYAWWGSYVGDSRPPAGRDPSRYGKDAEYAIGRKGTTPSNGSNGEWEIGVVPALDGNGYDLLCDTYGGPGGAILAKAGRNFNNLRREYAAAVATQKTVEKLSRHGWRVQREERPGNKIRLRLLKR